jgi:hypothetical protein
MTGGGGRDFAWILERELERLAREIEAYPSEAALWSTRGGQKNPPGTLALHLVGNLSHFVGAGLGGTAYVRDRTAEFTERDVPRAELLARIEACRETVTDVLESLEDSAVAGVYPAEPPAGMEGITTRALLLHLTWHLGWHLGQIYYHRIGAGEEAVGAAR